MISRAALVLPLSLLIFGCGSDSEESTAAADASVVITPDATPVNCSVASMLDGNFTSVDASGNGFADNPLDIEVVATISDTAKLYFNSYNSEPVPLGKQEMKDQWLDANCIFCLFINSVNIEAQQEHLWFPISGELDITSVKDNFVMTGTNLVFQHVKFVGETLAVEPASSCTVTVPTLLLDAPMSIGGQ